LNEPDPVNAIIHHARRLVLDAIERGWSGPPYNPFALAEMCGMQVLPTEAVMDARTTSGSDGRFKIEFNPQRPAARMRYSIAHELGHTLFPDCAVETRNRATHQQMKDDDWQLESLCNIAAAEILMPFGTLQEEATIRPSVDRVLDLRRKYRVSCEAVANRLIRMSAYPCCAFLSRLDAKASRYTVEYQIKSSALKAEPQLYRGTLLPRSSKASACTAIGVTEREDAKWVSSGKTWFIEYLGISPNSGEPRARVLALAFPPAPENFAIEQSLRILQGDATEPFGAGQKLLLQVVNDQATVWGGGFAKQARKKWPAAQAAFAKWAYGRQNLKLGNSHSFKVRADLSLVSLVAQHGFGKAARGPRLRYGAPFLGA
jgi:Zn-dependent peptidase ImmA (M78 family)